MTIAGGVRWALILAGVLACRARADVIRSPLEPAQGSRPPTTELQSTPSRRTYVGTPERQSGLRSYASSLRPVEISGSPRAPDRKPAQPGLRSITSEATYGNDLGLRSDSRVPVLVLLHGLASRPSEWLAISNLVAGAGPAMFVFPEGPEITVPPWGRIDGRAWWKLDLSLFVDPAQPGSLPDLSRAAPPGLVTARNRVVAFLDELEARDGIDSSRVVLGGFSQGAVVALDVALHDARPLRGLVLLSGTIVNEGDWFARLASRRGLPVFIAHSPQDTVLPFQLAQRLRDALETHGWQVTWRSFEGGHRLTLPVIQAFGAFAQAVSPER